MADESNRAEALPAFAGAVAHEIRTPLAAVAGEVELALCREKLWSASLFQRTWDHFRAKLINSQVSTLKSQG